MSLFGTGRREGFLAAMTLVALALVQHAPGIFFGQERTTSLACATDPDLPARAAAVNHALLVPAMRAAQHGAHTGWNSFARLGEPLSATSSGPLYPPFWLLGGSHAGLWLELLCFLHAALGCVLAYRMLRTLTASRYSAFLGGGVYGLGWSYVVGLDRLPEAAAAAWLPLVVDATWRCLFFHRRSGSAAILGIALAIVHLTGGSGTAMFATVVVGAALSCGLFAIHRENRWPAIRATAVAALLSASLTAPLWIDHLVHRGVVDLPSLAYEQGLPAHGYLGFFAPGLFGESQPPSLGAPDGRYLPHSDRDPIGFAMYPGALVLFVGLLSLLRPKRSRQILFWIALAGLALSFGTSGGLGDALRATFRRAELGVGTQNHLLQLAIAVLAAFALESFFDAPHRRRLVVPTCAGAVFAMSALTLLAFFAVPDLGASLVSAIRSGSAAPPTAADIADLRPWVLFPAIAGALIALAFLRWRALGILRFKTVVATVTLAELVLLALVAIPRAPRGSEPALDSLPAGRVLLAMHADTPPTSALRPVAGHAAVQSASRAILDRTRRVLTALEPGMIDDRTLLRSHPLRTIELLSRPFREVLALSAVVGCEELTDFEPLLPAPGSSGAGSAPAAVATTPPARARIAFEAVVATDRDEAASLLGSAPRSRSHSVILEQNHGAFTPLLSGVAPSIEWRVDRANLAELEVDMHDNRGWLVLADAHAPGWTCRVDGEVVPILPADVAVRAVALREGRHQVRFEYRALSLQLGLPLAAFGWVLALASWLYSKRR
ncbi:MAG: hypothetical protein AB7I19_14440 [Planctomycetota bacterium]